MTDIPKALDYAKQLRNQYKKLGRLRRDLEMDISFYPSLGQEDTVMIFDDLFFVLEMNNGTFFLAVNDDYEKPEDLVGDYFPSLRAAVNQAMVWADEEFQTLPKCKLIPSMRKVTST